jgi:hypothetical protein
LAGYRGLRRVDLLLELRNNHWLASPVVYLQQLLSLGKQQVE